MSKKRNEDSIWLARPAADDLGSADRYLRLLFRPGVAKHLMDQLKKSSRLEYPAQDLLRASQTHLLERDNPEVQTDLKKIKKRKKLSPVLLVRGNGEIGTTLTIADGYHRICASWHWDEKMPVACLLVDLPSER